MFKIIFLEKKELCEVYKKNVNIIWKWLREIKD